MFKNNPMNIDNYFKAHLIKNEVFRNIFEITVFAVLDRSKDKDTLEAFKKVFA